MKIKTSELTGLALDYAVVLCLYPRAFEGKPSIRDIVVKYPYSAAWHLAGPIIERERIELCSYSNDGVDTAFRSKGDERGNYSHEEEYVISVPEVVMWTAWVKYGSHKQDGPTPLIAAMRCYVASKMGDEVEIPDELT